MTSKVIMPYRFSIDPILLDPANIIDPYQSIFLSSMYGTLVHYNPERKIVGGVAESYHIEKNTIVFNIRNNIRTSDGYTINGEDVYLSFKRLLILNINTHGKLSDFLACSENPKKLTDPVSCLEFRGNEFKVHVKSEKHIPLFFTMLATTDYVILPKGSFDHQGDLKIKDHRNTSGGYYIDSTSDKSTIFKTNHGNYSVDERNPEVIELLHNVTGDKIEMLEHGEINVLPDFSSTLYRDIQRIKNIEKYHIYKSFPIILSSIHFNPAFRKKTSPKIRLKIGYEIKKAYLDHFKELLEINESHEAFAIFDEDSLTQEQGKEICDILSDAHETKLPSVVTADIYNFFSADAENVISKIDGFKYQKLNRYGD